HVADRISFGGGHCGACWQTKHFLHEPLGLRQAQASSRIIGAMTNAPEHDRRIAHRRGSLLVRKRFAGSRLPSKSGCLHEMNIGIDWRMNLFQSKYSES